MAQNQKVNLNTLPKGLTKKEFTALPNFKKIRSFFTWAGAVSIASGILILSDIGKVSQAVLQYGGSFDDVYSVRGVKLNLLFMVASIVLGILLIKMKTTKMAYILSITELVYTLLIIILGGTIGIGVIALLLSLAGAIRIDRKWKQYQKIPVGNIQGNNIVNNGFVSAGMPKSLKGTLEIYKRNKSWSAENDMIETLKTSKVWVPYISGKNQLDVLKNGERYYIPVFTSVEEMKEYGKKFWQREVFFSDVINMAKESKYALTGLVINAFTDSVILDWNQLGTIIPGGDDVEEETMYTR